MSNKFDYSIDKLKYLGNKYGYSMSERDGILLFELEDIDVELTIEGETKTYDDVVLSFSGDTDEEQDIMYLEAGAEIDDGRYKRYYWFEPSGFKEIEEFINNPAEFDLKR